MSKGVFRRLLGRLIPFRWPFVALAAALSSAFVAFGPDFFGKVLARLADEDWWADNLLVFVVFSGLTTWLISLAQRDMDRRWRRHFEGWQMEMVDGETIRMRTDLHWEAVEAYLNSELERWQAIKSFMSTLYIVNTPWIADARTCWLDDPLQRMAEQSVSSDGWLEPPEVWADKTIRIRMDKLREVVDVTTKKVNSTAS